jgi:preprotein translocase subunit SecB
MKASVLHIEGYHLKELSIELNESFAKKSVFGAWSGYHYHPDESYKVDPLNFKVNSEISKKVGDPFSLRYVLNIHSSGPKSKVPYSFKVSLVGYFHVDGSVVEKDKKQASVLLYANAPALLYAAARELLATTTGRGPYPAVILPSVSFLDDAERIVKKEGRVPTPKKVITAGEKKANRPRELRAKK